MQFLMPLRMEVKWKYEMIDRKMKINCLFMRQYLHHLAKRMQQLSEISD